MDQKHPGLDSHETILWLNHDKEPQESRTGTMMGCKNIRSVRIQPCKAIDQGSGTALLTQVNSLFITCIHQGPLRW